MNKVEDYFNMSSELNSLEERYKVLNKKSSKIRTAEEIAELKHILVTLPSKREEVAKVKASIKDLWKADNALKKKKSDKGSLDKAVTEYDNSVKRLSDTENILKKRINEANAIIKAEREAAIQAKEREVQRLTKESDDKKHFIKRAVMGKARSTAEKEIKDLESSLEQLKKKHKKDKIEYDKVIDGYFTSQEAVTEKDEKENDRKAAQIKERVDNAKKAADAVAKKPLAIIKVENERIKAEEKKIKSIKMAEESLKLIGQELDRKGTELTGFIKGYNDRIRKAMDTGVDSRIDNHFSDMHREYVNRTIMETATERKKDAKKGYLFAAMKYKSLSAALKIMDFSTDKLLYTVLVTGQGLIKGDVIQAKKDLNETVAVNDMISEVSANDTAVMYKAVQGAASDADSAIGEKIVRERMSLDKDNDTLKELSKLLAERGANLRELEEKQSKRIEDFNSSVIVTKEKSGIIDTSVREKLDSLRKEVITEIAGTNSVYAKVVEAEESINAKMEADLHEMEEADKVKYREKMESINQFSDSFGNVCTAENMGKLDTVLGVVLKIANFAIDKINSEGAGKENREPLTKEGIMESLKHSIESIPDLQHKKPEEYTLEQIIKLMPALYEKVNGIREYLEKMASEAEKDMKFKSRYSDLCNEEYDSCVHFIEESKTKKDISVTDDLLNYRKAELKANIEAVSTGSEEEIQLCTDAKKTLVDKKEEYEKRCKEFENISNDIADAKSEAEKLRQESINIFATTLRDKHSEPVGVSQISAEDILNEDMSGWDFLSKITGIEVNKEMTLSDVVRAFEKVYINGINAITYFGMDEDVEKAYLEDAKFNHKSPKTEEVIEQIRVNGLLIKAGLMYLVTDDEEKRKSYAHSQLVGQLIGVEDDNMHLCPVEISDSKSASYNPDLAEPQAPQLKDVSKSLSALRSRAEEENAKKLKAYEKELADYKLNEEKRAKNKKITEYNRHVKGAYNEFNEMRYAVAEVEIKKGLGARKDKEKEKSLSKEDALGKAILKSRGLDR